MKTTNIERYGVEYVSQSKEVKEKVKLTNMERYGVENPFQNEKIKEKMKLTNIERYGVEYASQCEEVREKVKATNIERYGVEYALQCPEVKEKRKATNIERYGVEHPMQNKELFEKNQRKRFKMKNYEFNCNNKVECQGDEPIALKELEENYDYTYEDYNNWNDLDFWYITKDKKQHKYYPDIPFLRENKIIEVKSNYTFYADLYENILKAKCVIEKGLNFEFWIYDNKKNKLVLETDLFKNNSIDDIVRFIWINHPEIC